MGVQHNKVWERSQIMTPGASQGPRSCTKVSERLWSISWKYFLFLRKPVWFPDSLESREGLGTKLSQTQPNTKAVVHCTSSIGFSIFLGEFFSRTIFCCEEIYFHLTLIIFPFPWKSHWLVSKLKVSKIANKTDSHIPLRFILFKSNPPTDQSQENSSLNFFSSHLITIGEISRSALAPLTRAVPTPFLSALPLRQWPDQ